MYIIKASGRKEEFKPKKILGTLLRAGASKKLADEVVKEVQRKIRDGATTKEILNLALGLLKNKNPTIGARYDLKRAIMNLGPTGFPFEKYFSEILKHYGYTTEIGRILRGKYTSHEVDVIAKKDLVYMVELKYHNSLGVYTNLKVALYVYARFLDLKKRFDKPWLATNTRLSRKALAYANGVGMKVTSWQYPKKDCLRELIEKKKLYPITILKSVNESTKHKLSDAGIMLAMDLVNYDLKELRRKTGISESILKRIIGECKEVCDVRI